MPTTNRYSGNCVICHCTVAARKGLLESRGSRGRKRHYVYCSACYDPQAHAQLSVTVIGDQTYTRNAAGRCIDAPCCGCCTI